MITQPRVGGFLRWAGSKAQIVDDLRSLFPSRFDRYVEPFCGSSVVFFRTDVRRALLADVNEDLILTLRQVQAFPERVISHLMAWPQSRSVYNRLRAQRPHTLVPIARAARFVYLNQLCFNGLYRENLRGEFNVPFSAGAKIRTDIAVRLTESSHRLATADMRHQDFAETIAQCVAGDFAYLDPPYVGEGRKRFAEYSAAGFASADLDRLEDSLVNADRRGIQFMLSYADGIWGRALSRRRKWRLSALIVRRNIAGFAAHRRTAAELVVRNY